MEEFLVLLSLLESQTLPFLKSLEREREQEQSVAFTLLFSDLRRSKGSYDYFFFILFNLLNLAYHHHYQHVYVCVCTFVLQNNRRGWTCMDGSLPFTLLFHFSQIRATELLGILTSNLKVVPHSPFPLLIGIEE